MHSRTLAAALLVAGGLVTTAAPLLPALPSMTAPASADRELSDLWLGIAEVVERDTGLLKTTAHVRALNQAAGRLAFRGRVTLDADRLRSAGDGLVAAVGLETQTLTPELRKQIADYFRGIAGGDE